ncbi:hypothetical protein [Halodesulfovibrio aestuarii]|uniref:Uncharacterized protein n=1 Tax=Halodesulfovibrio aestuarii TaxID=126333 RepID=A0ABV4JW87_9BACT
MTKDIIKDAVTVVAHRFTNPIWMTFICFWLVTNWKAVAFFFMSDFYVEERFKILSMSYSDPWNLYVIPFGFTALALFGMPRLLFWYRKGVFKAKTRLAGLSNNEETEILKSAFELANVKKEHALIESGAKDIDDLTEQLKIARAENERLGDQMASLSSELEKLSEKEVSQAAFLKDAEKEVAQLKEKHEEASKMLKATVDEANQLFYEREKTEKELDKIKTECAAIAQELSENRFSPHSARDKLISLSKRKHSPAQHLPLSDLNDAS